jgi:threonine/homoserine/homoserine lactone efflux protein
MCKALISIRPIQTIQSNHQTKADCGSIFAALFQWVNGKAWFMASGAIAAFTSLAGTFYYDVLQITAAFLLLIFPFVGTWLVFGAILRPLLAKPLPQRIFNISMGLLLIASVIPVIYEMWPWH